MQQIDETTIRNYLRGRLDAAARAHVEQSLQTDPALARQVALYRAELDAYELLLEAESRAWFKTWAETPQPRRASKRLWVFACLAIGLSVTLYAVFFRPPYAPPTLPPVPQPTSVPAVPSPAPKPAIPSTTPVAPAASSPMAMALRAMPNPINKFRNGPADSLVNSYQKAEQAFEAGQYTKTLEWLAQTDSTQQQSADFLAGHALFRLHRFAEAEAHFDVLVRQNSRRYHYHSEWGILLCRLAQGPNKRAAYLQQWRYIRSNPDHPYYEQAGLLPGK